MTDKPRKLDLRAEHLAITAEGVVLEGEAAAELATWLVQHNSLMMRVIRELDPGLEPGDLHVDAAGRVVLRSGRLQRLAFEAVRTGSAPGSARRLGRLVALTGGRIGTPGAQRDREDEPDKPGKGRDRPKGGPPPVRGESNGSHIDFFCPSDPQPDDGIGIDLVCYEGDPEEDPDINCACGWSY